MAEEKDGIRINKALAQAGLCSRRQADGLVEAGRVSLNGQVVRELGFKVREGDRLSVDGKSITVQAQKPEELVYLMLNKPVEVVSTARDPEGRRTVIDLLPSKYREKRVFPVGRLDFFSEGLLLLTNDGELTLRLTHPRFHLPKYYEVLVREAPTQASLELMRSGMRLSGGEKLAPVGAELARSDKRGHLLKLTLKQGVNRQIRRMCADLGLTILKLRRVGQGGLRLGGLKSGECRPLEAAEVAALKKSVGL